MRISHLIAAGSLLFALAACATPADDGIASAGGNSAAPSASPSATMSEHEAQLAYAQCMRKHGVDMPDPKEDGPITMKGKAGDNPAKMDKAQKACEHFLEAASQGKKRGPTKEDIDKMLKFAQCMRKNGIDMPDPEPDGRSLVKVPKGGEEKFQKAEAACKKFKPVPPNER